MCLNNNQPHQIIVYKLFLLQLVYLRRFTNLLTLNLSGNPIYSEKNYPDFIYAHLPKLEYLDYRLIDDQAVCMKCDNAASS